MPITNEMMSSFWRSLGKHIGRICLISFIIIGGCTVIARLIPAHSFTLDAEENIALFRIDSLSSIINVVVFIIGYLISNTLAFLLGCCFSLTKNKHTVLIAGFLFYLLHLFILPIFFTPMGLGILFAMSPVQSMLFFFTIPFTGMQYFLRKAFIYPTCNH